MKAIFFNHPDSSCSINETPMPQPGAGEVRIKIIAASLNRRDYWIKKGIYQGSKYPCIVGSDGSGIVESIGVGIESGLLGKEVIINPGINWGENPDYHSPDFHILGLPTQGTLAEFVCVPAECVWPKPAGWTFEKAAALPLGALTAYRALFTRGLLKKDDTVFLSGIGGGVATFMLKFAVAIGSKVFVSSSSEKKIKKAIQLGAVGGINYTKENWEQEISEMVPDGFELIVDSAAGANFSIFPSLLKIGGRIVIFGGTAGKIPELTAAKLFWKQASILGTTMGSADDFKNMLTFVEKQNIKPEIDKIFPFEDAEIAFKYMENQEQFGKIVIKIG